MNPGVANQRWKIKELQESIRSNHIHTPFFILTETHFKSYHLDAEIHIPNYTCYRGDRVNRVQGGAATYLYKDLTADTHKCFSNSYCEATMIYCKSANIVIIGVYRPPLAPFDKFAECIASIQAFIDTIERATELYIAGDFNLPFVNWNTCAIDLGKSILLSDRQSALELFDFMEVNFLQQMVSEPTRKDNILDLIFSNNTDMIHSISVSKTEKSDHDTVNCVLLHPQFLLPSHATERPVYSPSCLLDDINFNSANWESIKNDLKNVDWSQIVDDSVCQNTAWRMFEDTVANICSNNAPSHSQNIRASSKYSGIPKERRTLLKKKKRLNANINSIKYSDRARRNHIKLEHLQNERAAVELLMKADIKGERLKKEADAIEKIKRNPKAFYSYAKKSSTYKSPIGPLADDEGELHSDPTTMANLLQSQYIKAFSNPDNVDPDNININEKTQNILEDMDVTEQDVIKAIEDMQSSSAPGPDKFPSILLKECKEILAPPIALLWQTSLEHGEIADMFKEQSITPIYKKGSKSVPANYRPVSLTSHLIKLFERIIRKKMVAFIEQNDLLSPNQHGFRSGRNCLTQLLHHIDEIMCDLDSDDNADVLYLDFSKAFDKVDHNILLRKLQSYGIKGKLYNWISAFLTGRKQYVIVDGFKSFLALVLSGVPQGTVLGPLLFLIHIDDICNVVKHSKIKIFADDSKLHKAIRSLLDRLLLQEDLDNVIQWAADNNMELNQDKFQLLQHGKSPDLKLPYTLPSGQELHGSSFVKDLGVFIDPDLNWRTHIAMKSLKARNMASWVLRTFLTRDKETMMLLYTSFVRSHLEYCCPLWSPHLQCDIIQIEAVQRSFTSKIQGLRSMSYWERLKHLSLYSLQRRRERYMIIVVWKIYNNIIPNNVNITFRESTRHGTTCIRPLGSSKYSSVKTMRFNSFTSTASALYNVVPPNIKTLISLTRFKSELDAFLQTYPDTPPTPGYIGQNKNSMLEWAGSSCH